MACIDHRQEGVNVSFGIFRPEEGCHIDDAVAHMADVAAALEKTHDINVAILKSLDHQWAAVFASWKRGSENADKSAPNLPEAALFTKGLKCAVRTVDSGWFQLSSHQTSKGVSFLELLLGDIVSVRRIYCSWKRQDLLSYSCLAILRSYFNCMRGLLSYSFYDSLDGKQIMGLGVWKDVESASVVEKYRDRNPAMAYWRELGAKRVEYNVCQVVYVTYRTSAQNFRPGFPI